MKRAALAALALLAACKSEPPAPPPDDPFDGNVVVGDATAVDAAPLADARPQDGATFDAADAGFLDGTSADAPGPRDGAGDGDVEVLDTGTSCGAPAVATVTASAAVTRLRELEGMVVEIEGTLTETGRSCTELVCPADRPCCNTCTATVSIDGIVRLEQSACFPSAPACTGDTCVLVCTPPIFGLPQRVRGVVMSPARPGDLPARIAIMALLP